MPRSSRKAPALRCSGTANRSTLTGNRSGTRLVCRLGGPGAVSTTAWAAQQARNLAMDLGERLGTLRFLIHDRDPVFTTAFGKVFKAEGQRIITRLPTLRPYPLKTGKAGP